MNNMHRWRLDYMLLAMFLVLSPSLMAAAEEVGKTVVVIGNVSVTHVGSDDEKTLTVPNPVYLHDTITSAVGSRAKFMLQDDSILKLGSFSKIELTELIVGKEKQQTTIKQLSGQLRILLGKKLKSGSHYKIHSPVAVAGVRGTDFEVIVRTGGKTAIRCFEGEVAVTNIKTDIVGEVRLIPNHYTIVEKDTPPVDPIPIPAGQSLASALGLKKAKKPKDDSSAETEEFQEEEKVEGEHEVTESDADASTGVNNNRNREGKISGVSAGSTTSTDSLDAAEGRFVPVPNFAENSAAGKGILKVLGIATAVDASGKALLSNNVTPPGSETAVSYLLAETTTNQVLEEILQASTEAASNELLDDLLAETSGTGPDVTIEEPVLDSSAVAIQVIFPTQ